MRAEVQVASRARAERSLMVAAGACVLWGLHVAILDRTYAGGLESASNRRFLLTRYAAGRNDGILWSALKERRLNADLM